MRKKRIVFIVLLSCAIVSTMSSCVRMAVVGVTNRTKLEYVVPTALMYADDDFQGLGKFIDDAKDTASILLIHGLTRKTEDHFDFLVQRLAFKLQLQLTGRKQTIPLSQRLLNDRKNRTLSFGECKLFMWEFKRRTDKKIVNAYFVYWEPVFKTFKDFIMSYDSTRYRTGLSNVAKDSVFVNVLSDLALYLNTRCAVQMHDLLLQSVEKTRGDLAVVGSGFGVQMLFDAMNLELEYRKVNPDTTVTAIDSAVAAVWRLYGLKAEDVSPNGISVKNAALRNPSVNTRQYIRYKEIVTGSRNGFHNSYDIRKVFLIGNQLPFTSLLSLDSSGTKSPEELNTNVYNGFHKFLRQKQEVNPLDSLVIISFYDPNDPFGYRLPLASIERLIVRNVKVNIAEYWQIDPRKTTDFVVPKLNEKAAEFFLSVIDQHDATQNLMLNLEGPANQSRNDYRVIGALAGGSSYPFVSTVLESKQPKARELHPHAKTWLTGLITRISKKIVKNLSSRIDIENSVLPFSLPSQFRDYEPNKHLSTTFKGIDESVRANRVTQVITVHGVKNQEPDHFDMMTHEIAKTLGFYETPDAFKVIKADYGPGTIKVTRFKSVEGKELIIYNVYWSSITRPAKEWLKSTSIYDESSVIPKLVKDILVTDGLSDIELSFQGDHEMIMNLLSRAFTEMQRDFRSSGTVAGGPNTYYMTGSLGTRLLLDYLNQNMSKDSAQAVQDRTKTWFMLTNQLIITELKNVPLRQGKIAYDDYFKEAYGHSNAPFRKLLRQDSSQFEVVAFNDPNDIMSFIVPDDVMGIPGGDRIHNTYINIAQGVQVNMNALIKIAWRADKCLQKDHRKKYSRRLAKFKYDVERDSVKTLKPEEVSETKDMLRMSKKRFKRWFKFRHRSKKWLSRLENNIDRKLCADKAPKFSKLEDLLMEKKKFNTTDVFLTSNKVKEAKKKYLSIRRTEKRSIRKADVRGKPVIDRSSFRKLQKPGLIMPFLREVSNYRMYQDFVSDFGRAHVGSRTNKKIISMMALGFESVTKTDVDQELYRSIHNKNEH